MKCCRKFLFIICFLVISLASNAQFSIGIKAGLNFSEITYNAYNLSIPQNYYTGLQVGIISEIPLCENFYFQPGVFYSQKGSEFLMTGLEVQISPMYVEIPVNGLYKIKLGSKKILLFLGPYIAYAIGGSYNPSFEYNRAGDIKFGSGENDDLKRLDFGLNLGSGIEFNNFQISAQYGLGLANLSPSVSDNSEKRVSMISVSLAYLLRFD